MLRPILFALALGAPLLACAQTAYQRRSVALQPELQAEVAAGAHGYAYLALGGLRYIDYNNSASLVANRTLGFDTGYLAFGYEQQFASPAWSWGPTLRLATTTGYPVAVQPGLLLRHLSHLGPLVLGQRLGAEVALTGDSRLDPAYTVSSPYAAAGRVLLRLRLDLYPQNGIRVGKGLALTPRLGFEPALFLRLQQQAGDLDKRTIDYTGLRADVQLSLAKARLDVTPFFALQTRYYRTIVQYDSKGNPTSNGKLNSLLPTAGLELRYRLGQPTGAKGDFCLPTQH